MAVNDTTLKLLRGLRIHVDDGLDGIHRHLIEAWARAWNELSGEYHELMMDVADARAKGETVSAAKIARTRRSVQALKASRERLEALCKELDLQVQKVLPDLIDGAPKWQRDLWESQMPPAANQATIAGMLSKVDPAALEMIVGRTADTIHAKTKPIPYAIEREMKAALVKGVAFGDNPRWTAASMVRRIGDRFDLGLTRAMVISRTEMLDAHRNAAHLWELDNEDVMAGWEWVATLDRRTCFPAGTLITTSTGQKPIEQVTTGDLVLTHTGNYRRAYEPMTRSYAGSMVTVEAGSFKVTSTSDHPFLIEREGELQWVEARDIRRGDSVLSNVETPAHGVDHVGSEVTVERRRDQPHDSVTTGLHEGVLPGVPGGDLRVPVGLIDFETDVLVGQEEVDRTLPAGDGVLLDERHAKLGEAEPDVALRRGLPGVLPVAADGAEASAVRRNRAEALSTLGALDDFRWSSALFGAARKLSALGVEDRSASLARSVSGLGSGAFDRAVFVSRGVAERNSELDGAADARLGDTARRPVALAGARRGGTTTASQEGVIANGARSLDARNGSRSGLGVWMLALLGCVAGAGAVTTGLAVASSPRRRDLEMGSAPLASEFHRHIVSSVTTHYQRLTVHNVEVEDDHSYVANGLAVHNCPSCWAQHGSIHDVKDPGPLDHQQGRCARLPKAKAWADLGFHGIDEPDDVLPDAQTVFGQLTPEQQEAVMGKRRLDLLQSGKISWADLSQKRTTQGWRDSYAPASVSDLLAAAS